MPRLTSLEKGGFYPFPESYLPHVASLFTPTANGGKILDPCAGEGDALKHLAGAWNLMPYANELDHERAAACVQKFGAVQGDIFQLRASSKGFVAAWVNPPYNWDTGSDEKHRALRETGWHNYSLFTRDDGMLFAYFETPHSREKAQSVEEEPRPMPTGRK